MESVFRVTRVLPIEFRQLHLTSLDGECLYSRNCLSVPAVSFYIFVFKRFASGWFEPFGNSVEGGEVARQVGGLPPSLMTWTCVWSLELVVKGRSCWKERINFCPLTSTHVPLTSAKKKKKKCKGERMKWKLFGDFSEKAIGNCCSDILISSPVHTDYPSRPLKP